MSDKQFTRDELIVIAQSLNETLELDPPIKTTTKVSMSSLLSEVNEVVDDLEDGDAVAESVVTKLLDLEYDLPGKLKILKSKKAETAKKAATEKKASAKEAKKAPAKKEEKKADKKAAAKKPAAKKAAKGDDRKKTKYGSYEGTQAAFIDNLIIAKKKEADIVKAIAKQFDFTDGKARARFKAHTAHLKNKGLI